MFHSLFFSQITLLLLILQLGIPEAADSLSDMGAQSRAERFVLESLRKTGEADLLRLPQNQRSIRGDFLEKILFSLPDSQFPTRAISLINATVSGGVSANETAAIVTRDVYFRGCTFEDMNLSGVTFERNLTLTGPNLRLHNLNLAYVHIKGNLVLSRIVPMDADAPVSIDLIDARVDGFVRMDRLHVGSVVAQRLSTRVLSIGVTEGGNLDFSNLEAEAVYIGRSGRSVLTNLTLTSAFIKGVLIVYSSDIEKFSASGLHVGDTTEIEGASIKELDFTASDMGSLKLRVPACPNSPILCWPERVRIGAVSFRELGVGEYAERVKGRHHVPVDIPDDPQLGLEFLGRALYSEPAYTFYEQSLRSRGLLAQADDVYRSMHGHKRDRLWRESNGLFGKAKAVVSIAIDRAQGIFLGYGRSALQPFSWSLAFVVFGTIVFWKATRMEPIGEHPLRFSPFWYSLELFLPVVDLGVAKSWRPSQRSLSLLTYARIHQLAGWILIPVALAALTGVFK